MERKVCNLNEYDDSVWYRVVCSCGCDESLDFSYDIKKDDKLNIISLSFYTKMYMGYTDLFKRITTAIKLIFTGKYEMYNEFYLYDVEHIDSFITALNEGKTKILKK